MYIRDRNSGTSEITDTLTLSDIDDMNLEGATIQVTGNYIDGEDILSFADTPTINSSFDPLTGTLTLMGTDSVANYQAALRSVTYENLSDDPQASKTVTFTVSDDEFDSNTQSRNINIGAVNDAPVESAIELTPLAYTCLLYTSPSPRDATLSRMPSSA